MTAKEPVTKNQQFLIYILRKLHKANITTLVKLSYFCDLASVKSKKDQITSYKYVRFYYGPYTEEVKTDVYELVNNELVRQYVFETPEGKDFYEYEYIDTDCPLDLISAEEGSLIDEIVSDLSKLNARQLGLLSYETAPMKNLGATPGGDENLRVPLQLDVA